MRRLIVLSAAVLAALGARGAQAQIYQAPYGVGGTWNLYEFVDLSAFWIDANDDAMSRVEQGATGQLVDILSAQENAWVFGVFGTPTGVTDLWIGLTDREGVAPPGVDGDGDPTPQESGTNGAKGWAWTSGEPVTYTAWGGGEPNDSGGEDAAHIRSDGLWNDHKSGWGPDEPIVPVLQPGTSTDETAAVSFMYVIEYPTQRATSFDFGVYPYPIPDALWPTGADLPGVDGGAGTMGVTDYRGDSFTFPNGGADVLVTLQDIVDNAIDFEAYTAQVTKADVADPDTSAAGGPKVGGTPVPFPSDTPGTDDQHIITVGRATIQVPETGTYTLQVHSDDGFGLRVLGKPFKNVFGGGQLDPVDGSIVFTGNTGDSNTRGVIDLPAGKHDIEFLYWEHEGGAFFEISSAQGDVGSTGAARWLALGDATVLPETTTGPVANLTGPMFVGNLLGVGPDVEIAREDLLDNIDNLDAESASIEEFLIDDNNTARGCPFNEFPAFHNPATVGQWPLNDPDVGGDATNYENFASIILGQFTVNDGDAVEGENLLLSFHIDVDDRSLFHVLGQNFDDVSALGGDGGIIEIDGDDSLYSNFVACNGNYTGLITLTEGETYEFEAIHVEEAGDSGMQVLVALGDYVNNPIDATAFFPLTTNTDAVFYPANMGLAFVEKGGPAKPGDYNENGQLDAGDLDLQALQMESANPDLAKYDENNDGLVNFADREVWVNDLKNTWIGDANLNGEFNSGDMVQVFARGKYETGNPAGWEDGDFNGDTVFGSGDMVAAFVGGGYELGLKPGGPNPAVSAVPEPGSLVLLLIGLAGLMGLARRR